MDLFRFGARVYARYQPQFLNEFVLDNLDPGSDRRLTTSGSAEMRFSGARSAWALSRGRALVARP